MGSSFFTTIVLALIIHEKSKLLNGMPSRSDDVSILYRKSIAACALICIVGSDIILGVLNAIAPRDNLAHNPARNFTFLFGIYGFGQVIVAVYFLSRARALYWPLVAYLNDPQSTPTSENEAHMKYLAHYLTLSGTAMIVNTCSLINIAVFTSGFHIKSVYVWFSAVYFFSASRICVSYSKWVCLHLEMCFVFFWMLQSLERYIFVCLFPEQDSFLKQRRDFHFLEILSGCATENLRYVYNVRVSVESCTPWTPGRAFTAGSARFLAKCGSIGVRSAILGSW